MTQSQLSELMHAVLDGEATPAQSRELERRLTSDPAARREYDALRAIFFELQTLPSAYPPEGLVDSVMADLPVRQLSGPSRVIDAMEGARSAKGAAPPNTNTVRRTSRSWPLPGSSSMSEQSGSKRKVWIGVGLVALAAIIVAFSGMDFPPGTTSTSGAIVPAQRYRADQPATTGVGQASPTDAQRAAQPAGGNVGDARSDSMKSDARSADALKSDGRAADAMKSDGRAADAMKSDGRAADAMKSDGRSADAMKSDGRAADAMKSDGRAADALKADGRAGDSRAADGRKSGEGQKDFRVQQ